MKKLGGLIYILIIALISLFWFKGSEFLMGVDSVVPLDISVVDTYFSLWSRSGLGFSDVIKTPVLFPYAYLIKLFYLIFNSFNPQLFERLLVYVLFAGSGVSTYILSKKAFPSLTPKSHFISALLYMFNFYVMFLYSALPFYITFSYSFFPLVFALYIEMLGKEKNIRTSLILSLVSFLLLTPAYATPPYIIIHFFILAFYMLSFLIVTKSEISSTLKLSFFSALFFLILSSFWIFPAIFTPKPPLDYYDVGETTAVAAFRLNSSRVVDAIRAQGYFGFTSSYRGYDFYPWFNNYRTNELLVVISFLLVLLSYSGLFFTNQNSFSRFNYLFFSFLSVILIFFSSFGSTFMFDLLSPILSPLKFFELFRTSYQRFTPFLFLTLALMGGYSFHMLNERIKSERMKFAFLTLVIVVLGVYNFPLITGSIFDQNGILTSKRINFPGYYHDYIDYLKLKSDGVSNILSLPFNKLGLASFYWSDGRDGYDGINPILLSGDIRLFIRDSLGTNGEIIQAVVNDPNLSFGHLGKIFGIKYVLLNGDAHWSSIGGNSWWVGDNKQNLLTKINADPCLSQDKVFDEVSIYKVIDECQGSFISLSLTRDKGYIFKDPLILFDSYKILPIDTNVVVETLAKSSDVAKLNLPTDNIILRGKPGFKLDLQEEYWHEGWVWPDTTYSPNSLMYKLVRFYEDRKLAQSKDTVTQADLLSWLLSKRVQEMVHWKVTGDQERKLTVDVNSYVTQLQSIFKGVKPERRDIKYYNAIRKAVSYLEKNIELLDNYEHAGDLEKTKNEFYEYISSYQKKCGDICYELESPLDLNYRLHIDKYLVDSTSSPEFYLNGVLLTPDEIASRKDVVLIKGKNLINVKFENPENIVKQTTSVLTSLVTGSSEPLKFQGLFKPSYISKYSDYKYQELENWEGSSQYEVAFEYMASGGKISVALFESEIPVEDYAQFLRGSRASQPKLSKLVERDFLESNGSWSKASFYVTSSSSALDKAYLLFGALFSGEGFTNIQVRNVSVVKKNPYTLIASRGFGKSLNTVSPKFEKISATSYKVPFQILPNSKVTLAMRERMDPGWGIYKKTDLNSLSLVERLLLNIKNFGAAVLFAATYSQPLEKIDSRHYAINGYSNGWDVNGNLISNSEVIIKYYPQDYLYIGTGISALFLFFSVLYIAITKLQGKNANR